METTFRIVYDDQPNEVIDKVSAALAAHGLTITTINGGDGYEDYQIAPPIVIKQEPEYEFEIFFDSQPGEPVQIHGWYPITRERIRNPDKIDELIEKGLLRNYQKESPENL